MSSANLARPARDAGRGGRAVCAAPSASFRHSDLPKRIRFAGRERSSRPGRCPPRVRQCRGLRAHVALAGPEDAPPIVLVHGWPQNWWAWRRVIPGLAERFRVIAPDLRGHGWTEAPGTGYEKEQLRLGPACRTRSLGVERATWVGHDWGGWTGVLAALRAPERFDRMLAVCIPHLWVQPTLSRLWWGSAIKDRSACRSLGQELATRWSGGSCRSVAEATVSKTPRSACSPSTSRRR